mmetsp:Transcript_10568/g.23803  ORF Transcript_10568/g.23803 Transcript_10568/m.23803 type:complete len:238 (+) Transcript_10568:311-1024(+)
MGEDRAVCRGLCQAVRATQDLRPGFHGSGGRLLHQAVRRYPKTRSQRGGAGGMLQAALQQPGARAGPAHCTGLRGFSAQVHSDRPRCCGHGGQGNPGEDDRWDSRQPHGDELSAGSLWKASRLEQQGAVQEHLSPRLQLPGSGNRRSLPGVQRHFQESFRLACLPATGHPGPGDQPSSGHAALRPTRDGQDIDCQAARQVPQGSGAQDHQRPRGPEQVCRPVRGEHPEALRRRGEGV